MDADLRRLTPLNFTPPVMPVEVKGERPRLEWLPVSALRVDPRYQREILGRGARNIRRIIEGFDWRLFTPVICVAVEDGVYAIIDGQHRATAALMHPHVREVPCQIVDGDLADQARAFVAINDQVTRLTSLQIFAAALAAGESGARDVWRCCKAAGVTVPAYPKPRFKLGRGETLAIGAIREAVAKAGAYATGLALAALAAQDEEGGGLVNRDTIKGLVGAIQQIANAARDKTSFLEVMAAIDLRRIEDEAQVMALAEGGTLASRITEMILARLRSRGGVALVAPQACKVVKRRGIGSY